MDCPGFQSNDLTHSWSIRQVNWGCAARLCLPPGSELSATLARVKTARIAKIAGLSFVGFVAASIVADKVNLNPLSSQIAGFAGAFFGTLVGRRRAIRRIAAQPLQRNEASVRPALDRNASEQAE